MKLAPLVLAAATIAQAPAPDWPQFRGNPALTGVTAATLPPTLKVLWSYEAGDSVESSAAIANGAVYFGSEAGELTSLDLANGAPRWKYKAKEGIGESSPAVTGDTVYVGDLAGVVHAVSAKDGKARWTFAAGSEVRASPVVVEDRVVIGSYDSHLYCLSAAKGALLWKYQTQGPVHATASIAEGIAYISGCDGMLRGIRISDGRQVTAVRSGAYTGASPVLGGGWAFFGTFNNDVLGVNLRARRIAWRYENKQRQFPFYSSAALVDGKVILGGRDKLVHCLDAKTGKEVWSFTTRARVDSSPAVSSGRVYVGSNDGRLYVLDAKTGAKIAEFEAGGPISASPAIVPGRLVIGTQDGKVYCLGG